MRLHRAVQARRDRAFALAGHTQFLAGAVVITATLFNAGLAVVNGITPMTSGVVMGVEVVLVALAHLIALTNYRPIMAPWYGLIAVLVFIALVRGVFVESFDPKLLRDALLIPTFIILGMTFEPRGLVKVVCILVTIVAAFMVLEAISSDAYAGLFNIQSFYINTRGFTEDFFWNKDSPLFASATRPDGRFFNIVDLHRLSSVFLEPVGSETFCIVVWSFICSCYSQLSRRALIFLIPATILMIIGTDGRLALVLSVLIITISVISPRMPRWTPFLYLPVIAAAAALLVHLAGLRYDADNFGGRLAFSTHLIGDFDFADLMGISNTHLVPALDAGFAYFIVSQSLIGTLIIWTYITLIARGDTVVQVRQINTTALWLSMFMMVGAAFLSIKTAGLTWFIFGSIQRDGVDTTRWRSMVPHRMRRTPR
jgi:putative polymerase